MTGLNLTFAAVGAFIVGCGVVLYFAPSFLPTLFVAGIAALCLALAIARWWEAFVLVSVSLALWCLLVFGMAGP